jgi:YD repeat-containing protein
VLTEAQNHQINIYDAKNQLSQVQLSDGRIVQYKYDKNGNPFKKHKLENTWYYGIDFNGDENKVQI